MKWMLKHPLQQFCAPPDGDEPTVLGLVDGSVELPGFVASAFPTVLYDERGAACISVHLCASDTFYCGHAGDLHLPSSGLGVPLPRGAARGGRADRGISGVDIHGHACTARHP